MSTMRLTITTIDSILWDDEAQEVVVPGKEGVMTVLPHHVPLVSELTKGKIVVKMNGTQTPFDCNGGFLEIGKDRTIVLLS